MRLPERFADLHALISSLTLDGKQTALHHLERGRDRLLPHDARDATARPAHETTVREAITEVRCAMEQLFLAVAREVSAARGEPLGSDRPMHIRERLVALGIITSPRTKEVVAKVYGVGSEKSAHPGFPDRLEAEHHVGLLLDTMTMVAKRYDAAMQRGFAEASELVDHDSAGARLAQMLHRHVIRDARIAARVVIDEHGVKQVIGGQQPGDPPLHFSLRTRGAQATEKLRRVVEHGKPVTLRGEDDEFEFELDERLADLLGDVGGEVELRFGPAEGRHVRLVVGDGSSDDIPFAEILALVLPAGGRRLLVRSPHLSHELYFDQQPGTRTLEFTAEHLGHASAVAHLRMLRLLRAALATNTISVRSLPEDELLLALPLGEIARRAPTGVMSSDTLAWYELLARLERALSVTLPPYGHWTDEEVAVAHHVDALLRTGVTRLSGSVTVHVDGVTARNLATYLSAGEEPLVLELEAGKMFSLAGVPVPLGLLQFELTSVIADPPLRALFDVPTEEDSIGVTLSSATSIIVRRRPGDPHVLLPTSSGTG